MRINYSFVEFHAPVFSNGKNHGAKIKASPDVSLYYDSEIPNAKMCMEYKGKLTTFDTYHTADIDKNDIAFDITKTIASVAPTQAPAIQMVQENKSARGRKPAVSKLQGE